MNLITLWRDRAEQTQPYSESAAAAMRVCADELEAHEAQRADMDEELSTTEYAMLHNKAPSTVRSWCASGKLRARPVGTQWVIRRGEPCPDLHARKSA